jgi:hypothetical protein
MENSIVAGWSNFMVATVGATAALAGLVFVAISINLARIIERPGVSGRAAETIILLAGALAGSLAALIPHLKEKELGSILLFISVPTWILPNFILILSVKRRTHFRSSHAIARAILHQAATLPAVLTGLSFLGVLQGGLIWFGVGAIISILVAMFNAWVLLIEILR